MTTETTINFDEDAIYWKEFRSRYGKKYEVGYLKKYHLLEGDIAQEEAETKTDFGICVDWPVGDSSWKYTNDKVRDTSSITRYDLKTGGGILYNFTLFFTNTQHYNYYFYDETGDYYQVNTFRNGDHFVRYSSDKPNIVFITGS